MTRPGTVAGPGEAVDDDALPPGPGARPAGPFGRFAMQVLWPAFLVSVVAEGLLFSMVDPHELVIVGLHLADSREATYSVGFFLLWALFSVSSGLTWWLASCPPAETR